MEMRRRKIVNTVEVMSVNDGDATGASGGAGDGCSDGGGSPIQL